VHGGVPIPGTGHEASRAELEMTRKLLIEQVRPLAIERSDVRYGAEATSTREVAQETADWNPDDSVY
jgi:hypothetical protein